MEFRSVYRLMAYLFFVYSAMTIVNSYIPVFFREEGLSGSQVGMLMAVGPFATIIAQPIWGYMSDKYKTIKRMILLTLLGVLTTGFVFIFMDSFNGYLVMMFVLFLFLSSSTALGDSLSQRTASDKKISFGRIRMWGSLGFASTSLIAGYILMVIGVQHAMILMLVMAFIASVLAFTLKDITVTNKPVTILSALRVGLNPALLLFFPCAMLISISHRTNDSFLGIYIMELGGPESLIGWSWFIGVATEAAVFATSGMWLHRWKPITLMIASGLLYGTRWFIMSVITVPWMILPLQLTHGICFGLFYIGGLQFVSKLVPEQLQATGHLLFLTVSLGVCGIFGSLVGGWMIEVFGLPVLYVTIGTTALLGAISLTVFQKMYKPSIASEHSLGA
ncbi:MFS transporter [Halalkalibacter urbisdiaboli]|uniref:MFS transporter n=1 Tax=Halalkalibacter urbisdiaboli TaxID=1960589 RepID=UPI000B446F2F|nr:MFS transporter [Halalkalibacter urbisdiaboli]